MKFNFITKVILGLFCSITFIGTAHAATILVTERADSFDMGNCSLRDAVQSVNTGSDFGGCVHTGADYGTDDTILLQNGAPYVVSLPGSNNDNTSGDIDICTDSNTLLIQGEGMETTTVMGNFPAKEEDRIFDAIGCDQTVTMKDLTVTNGGSNDTNGGGIQNGNTSFLTLMNVRVQGNFGDQGGGIRNLSNAHFLMLSSEVTGNQGYEGGGIFNGGYFAINESTISGNQAVFGGGIYGDFQELEIYNSTISQNSALVPPNAAANGEGDGGGIYLDVCDTTIMVNTTISSNQASFAGGGIFAIGGVCGQGITPTGAFLFNNTVAFNEVLEQGGQGGGIFFLEPQQIKSVNGAGFPGFFPQPNLFNTLLANNTADQGPDCYDFVASFAFNLVGDTTDCTFFEARVDPNKLDTDPLLGMLQDNGGPTETHGLTEPSPAIDMGNNEEGCLAPDLDEIIDNGNYTPVLLTRDQRGFPRPIAVRDPNDPICDIGAFEFQVFDFTVTKDDGLGGAQIPVGTSFDYTIEVTNNGPGAATAVTLNDPLPAGMDFVSVTPSQGACAAIGQVIGCDLGDLAEGATATVTVKVTATETGSFTNVVTVTLNNPFQQQLTETAQVTTTVGGDFIEGSGFHCGLQRGTIQASPRWALALALMTLALIAAQILLRRRAQR